MHVQVRFARFRKTWITTANDDLVRLWDENGRQIHAFRYKGGSVKVLFVDEVNELMMLATLDLSVSVYVLDHPAPIAT